MTGDTEGAPRSQLAAEPSFVELAGEEARRVRDAVAAYWGRAWSAAQPES